MITGRVSEHRVRNSAVAGFVGAAGVGLLEEPLGFLPALAVMTVVVVVVLTVASLASRARQQRE